MNNSAATSEAHQTHFDAETFYVTDYTIRIERVKRNFERIPLRGPKSPRGLVRNLLQQNPFEPLWGFETQFDF
jgi:glycine cleavage system aminomethyltransferase T